MPPSQRRTGFTLIELLTVIAIISILAAIVSVALPRALERAKINRATGAVRNIQQALTQYFADWNSYPPGYGFLRWEAKDKPPAALTDNDFWTKPYLALLNLQRVKDLYDEFSENGDANRDGRISLLEFSPIGATDPVTNKVIYPTQRYNGSNLTQEVNAQLSAEKRPFIYIPVNKRQFERARQYWVRNNDWYAQNWDPSAPELAAISFPPPSYDAYVLISVGPGGSTFGVVPDDNDVTLYTQNPRDVYHILALRAFFLATRDRDQNGTLDFDFLARTRQGEAKTPGNELPDPKNINNVGPLIFAVR
jgi:prepilin-type N-terminal cleavage/methylation domain-containing protein